MSFFDVLIIGGGVAGVSCAQVLASAYKKPFMQNKTIGIVMHQKASMLQEALFNNAYGIKPGTLGSELLAQSKEVLKAYDQVVQIEDEKVISVLKTEDYFIVKTNKNEYACRLVVVATNSSATFTIEGLTEFIEPHKKSLASKNRIQLKNKDHLVIDGIYVAGTLAGHRSQLAIAAGSGAAVATDIMTFWNDGVETHSHDSIKK